MGTPDYAAEAANPGYIQEPVGPANIKASELLRKQGLVSP